jgi:hypothetical protein
MEAMGENEVKCPRCPVCDSEPAMGIHPMLAQAWCWNDDCQVLCWDPWVSLDENMLDMSPAIVTENEPPD